jgi:hypothetical protein
VATAGRLRRASRGQTSTNEFSPFKVASHGRLPFSPHPHPPNIRAAPLTVLSAAATDASEPSQLNTARAAGSPRPFTDSRVLGG